ncbi:hypothetical protein RchiOBHm_Chr6g0261441 [Rosa chinensis]|uniref:Uncharacterized protein n=1 Tax=Rosa chinensis TaxID=74649 RepID=A0A2P6PNE1_ROSCH|nr:hypothetical protein RchiOBHm_Chr6g0261441 [Rosa chinensis]
MESCIFSANAVEFIINHAEVSIAFQLSASQMFLALKSRKQKNWGYLAFRGRNSFSWEIQIVNSLQTEDCCLHNNVYKWNNWRTKRRNHHILFLTDRVCVQRKIHIFCFPR